MLSEEGLIDEQHGRGAFVRRPRTTAVCDARAGVTERETGLEHRDLVFSAKYREIKVPKHLAVAFGVRRARLSSNTPTEHAT